jgi:hypothetical protein
LPLFPDVQRIGRLDRFGAKAERAGQPIQVYIPYIAETQDEKIYRVVMDRHVGSECVGAIREDED